MRINYKGGNSLKTVLDFVLHYDKELVSTHDMAKRIDAPIKFLEHVLLDFIDVPIEPISCVK